MALEILIVGDIRLYREGLAQVLSRDPHFRAPVTAHSRLSALDAVASHNPDAVLIDMAMPESLDTAREIAAEVPHTKVVALGLPEVEAEVIACAEAGVSGYVSRDASLEDLASTLRSVGRGELPCSPRVAGALLRRVRSLARNGPTSSAAAQLTRRELEVLGLVDEALTNKEIAARLHVSPATIKNHVHNILEKLNVHHRAEAVSRVGRENLPRGRRSSGSPAAPVH